MSVAAVVHDVDETSVFHLQSDQLGPYQASGGILSQIFNDSGDWLLDLRAQTSRTVALLLDPMGSTSPAGPGYYNARMISRCFDADGSITGFLQIAEGSSNTRCSLRLAFTHSNVEFALRMGPLEAGTDWVTASCLPDTDTNTTCEQWTIVAGTSLAPAVANLYRLVKNKEALVGAYRVSFKIGATRQ